MRRRDEGEGRGATKPSTQTGDDHDDDKVLTWLGHPARAIAAIAALQIAPLERSGETPKPR
jgi:hypothetical protein